MRRLSLEATRERIEAACTTDGTLHPKWYAQDLARAIHEARIAYRRERARQLLRRRRWMA